jgi:hypothetical protein
MRALNFITALTAALAAFTAHADPLIDLGLVTPPRLEQRAMPEPVVTWIVSPRPSSFCASVKVKDGFIARAESCAYWHFQTNNCTMVTSSSTAHSELGHLFLACLRGGTS